MMLACTGRVLAMGMPSVARVPGVDGRSRVRLGETFPRREYDCFRIKAKHEHNTLAQQKKEKKRKSHLSSCAHATRRCSAK